MLYPIICFDIDGTLINNRTRRVDETTKQALRKLKDLGFRLGVVTGRALGAVQDEKIDQLIGWDFLVLNNGQRVLNQNYETIYEEKIDPQLIRELIAKSIKRNYGLLGQGERWKLYTPINDAVIKVHQELGGLPEKQEDYQEESVYTLIGYGTDHSLFKDYPMLKVVPGIQDYADIILASANKYVGLSHVIDEPYIAFGDSLNDLEFLNHSALSLAMKNSPQELKKIASYVSDVDADEIYTICELFNWFMVSK